ncbi:sporulation protein YpjB [Bacillus mesophilus]|uniref:Sporulation protein YpjB n=1 Tax=Bacillus mesophilus TaxID=1808955 RepID=A0A6M0Q841_9BACI|nr:sporulation protein YpjB [Bacillus mesophilus]MBM7661269.1 sporulation protein YpjB [Bacillus mesophilus]NEY71208.1 sporulation protein YpjB [Bacillus mesophilus]
MSRWIVIFIAVLVFMTPSNGLADHTDNWEKLDIITDQALQLVKHQKYDDAQKLLSYFSDQFSKVIIHENSFTMDEIRVITASYEEAELALTSESLSHEECIKAVTKFRLVVDAVKSEHQPLWTEMETSVMATFHTLKEAVNSGDSQVFQHELNSFLGKYDIIYPSVRLDLDTQQSEKINAYVTYMDESRDELLLHDSRMEHMQVMEEELIRMFKQMKEDDADPSLIWVMISTGSIIIVTLSYVAWRKYKGDKEKQASRKRLND